MSFSAAFAIRKIIIVLILSGVTMASRSGNGYEVVGQKKLSLTRYRPLNSPLSDPFGAFDPFKTSALTSSFSSTSAPLSDPFKLMTHNLKVATFNIWGLVTAKDRLARLDAITRYFTKNPRGLDIICLQELWMADDYRTVRAALSLEFPHAHYFKSGVVGSGLAVFSKFPIQEAWWKGFTLTGKAHRIFDGDWFAGKGIGAVRIKHPVIGDIDVFNTHVSKKEAKILILISIVDC